MIVGFLLSLFIGAIGYALWRLFGGYGRRHGSHRVLAHREAVFLAAAAEAVFPPGGAIPVSGREADLPGYADHYLDALPRHLRLQVRALFLLMEQATIVFPAPAPWGRRRFSALSPEQRIAVLESWSESRLFARRLVFTALRAVLTMGYLGHPRSMRAVGMAPYAIDSPTVEADLLYPPVGGHPADIRPGEVGEVPEPGQPLFGGPIHPAWVEDEPEAAG